MADPASAGTSGNQRPPSRVEARRYDVERSCIRCHRRKIRCDKSAPCSACVRSENADSCRYPGPERIKRKARKQVSTTLVQQVERLEQMVSNTLKQNVHSNRGNQTTRSSSSSSEHQPHDGDPRGDSSNFTGLLIKNGNLVRYVNDNVLLSILEKEEEMRSAITSPHVSSSADTPSLTPRPLSLLHPISKASFAQVLEDLFPTRRRAIQLWQTFVLNVDPMIKVLHIPTMQPVVYAAITESHSVTPDLRALLFAIYFSALTSTLRNMEGYSTEDHQSELEQFKQGVEISLSQGDFLEQPSMYSLQAITIFISAFRSFGSGRSIWTINGTIIRAAQLMGIHRDGKHFNLSPFEQEMRRRLWWKIITIDSRTLEDQGVWINGNRSLGDARMPLNIDDRDIDSKTTIMPQERIGFTEATPLISVCHIQIAGEALAQLSLCGDLESYSRKLPIALETIARTRGELEEKFFSSCSPHIPIQRMFKIGIRAVLDKIEWQCQEGLLRHQQKSESSLSQRGGKVSAESDALFTRACELLETVFNLVSNEMHESFAWYTASYLPYELLTFVLWRLYMSPTGPAVDGAWDIVSRTFSVIHETSVLPDKGPRWTILCKLKEKVAGLRGIARDKAEMRVSPGRNFSNARTGKTPREENLDGDLLSNGTLFDSEDLLFSMDWATFQHSLNSDGRMWP